MDTVATASADDRVDLATKADIAALNTNVESLRDTSASKTDLATLRSNVQAAIIASERRKILIGFALAGLLFAALRFT